ncbi:sugar ABC transporter substrate-binding protein [Salinisphaera sp.]|uniref:sugar ABC transporter substrate-binding protein n=1 Tax=Salinisphaera sp. TaxID=1914330 RepID=UPI002D79B8AE|nr:sugar ABC transporter substrate-binding protein [Salinisphaera sp.]HET7315033.1 sugar ABC transporter substrate-binding protein [Salinisphaera sp.]
MFIKNKSVALMLVAVFLLAIMVSGTASAKKYKIYLSLSYSGNVWQAAAANDIKALANTPPYDKLVDLREIISGTSPQAQISDYQSMIANGADAIISFPVSPTALNRVIERGCHQGVKFFMYDATVTASCAYNVSYITSGFGENTAQYLVNLLGGKGNVMINRGVPGNTVDTRHYNGMMSVFKKYPGIHIVDTYYGYWSDAKSRKATAQALAAHPNVDAIASQLGEYGVFKAALAADPNHLPVITGEDTNGIRLAFATPKYQKAGLKGVSSGSPPATAGYAFKLLMEVLQGKMKLKHHDIQFPLPWVPSDQVKLCPGKEQKGGCNTYKSGVVPPTWTDAATGYPALLPELNLEAARTGKPVEGRTIQPLPPIGKHGVVYAPEEVGINCESSEKGCSEPKYEVTKVKPIPVPSD